MTRKENSEARQRRLVDAFLELRSALEGVVGRIVGYQDVEDIVEETFLRSYEAAGKHKIHHPRSFMRTTAKNLALNHVARADHRLTDSIEDSPGVDRYLAGVSLEAQVDSEERFVMFCRGVRQLPLQCRRAFILKKVYGLSQKEIAQYLGISQSTVEKHVSKGLSMCSEYLRSAHRLGDAVGKPTNTRHSGGAQRS